VGSTIDPASGGVAVHAEITSDTADMPLRPGAFIEVEMPDRLYEDVVQLPASALFGGNTVYVIDDSRLKAAMVELVAALGDQVLIEADLVEGTPVVTSRLAEIAPGLKVRVAE
jgi:multidrug efflux pump subunit AcrA (membrane-fusion protein)